MKSKCSFSSSKKNNKKLTILSQLKYYCRILNLLTDSSVSHQLDECPNLANKYSYGNQNVVSPHQKKKKKTYYP